MSCKSVRHRNYTSHVSLFAFRSKPEKALKEFDKAIKAYENQMVWRDRATVELIPALTTYERAIRDTIGARAQSKMSPEQALYVASCSSGHRDISLSF